MHAGIGYHVGIYEFAFPISFDMIFIAVITLSVLFCPSRIDIFLLQFIGMGFPLIGDFTLFYLFVFLPVVSLNRDFNKTGINNFPFVGYEIVFVKFFLNSSKYFSGYISF